MATKRRPKPMSPTAGVKKKKFFVDYLVPDKKKI